MKFLASVLGLAVAACLLAACSSAGSGHHAGQINASQGGSIIQAGAKLSVPPGAVSGNGQLGATTTGAPPPIQPTGTGQVALSAASAPVRFTLSGSRIIKPVGITFRVRSIKLPSEVPAARKSSAVWLSSYNPAVQRWQAVASHYDPATGTVSAQVSHLSWWMAWTWDWAGLALRIRQALSSLGSGRASATSCPGVSQVTVTSLGEPDAPLIGCAEQGGSGTLTVSVTNNRGLTQVMSGVPADATPGAASYSGLAAYLSDTAFRKALAVRLGGAILPPTETLTYTLPLHGPSEVFIASATVRSYLLDLALTAGEKAFGNITKDYATCAFNTVLRSQVPTLADIPGLATSCLPVLARQSPALKDLARALGKRFIEALDLLIFDVKALLQDYDLSYDAIRAVSGRIQIDRPAVVVSPSPRTACPDSTQLLSAWNAAPAAIRQSWVSPQVTGFTYITCWHGWVVAEPTAVSPGNGAVVFSQMGTLHLITVTELQHQFRSAVCSAPDAPAGWKNPPLLSCN